MSFRFYQPDDAEPVDAAGDLPATLPPDLAALGEQLQADAQRLGHVYPACRAPFDFAAVKEVIAHEEEARRRDFTRNLIIAVSSAAALLFIAACIQLTWLPPANVPEAVAADVTLDHPAHLANSPAAPELQPVSFRPAIGDMNGPELEGVLDLLDEQPQAAAVISF